ncbi:flavin reductase family protein [Seohaeicola sp. SP36]|uniref:flavin reductase family protein n=1 Tax=unclassified Seohaeicola TaxID=2641111 RepID=UPI00237A909D|nr:MULTISPECIES: flavin reductase family protein [unclassified Seohaeicola]MDD9707738.1 flavin reductase family protein [Seohaeicola sp. 4SK31]MDD9735980.1 flavin reductase family protein [Seohaeicola sp. SP36]
MEFDFTQLPPQDRYRLLTNFVGPRPIALVTTRSEGGHSNAAPMSFFNVFSQDPPIVILGVQTRGDGQEKDTLVNIRRTGQFCVNMVDMELAEAMILCGVNFAPDVDEPAFAGLDTAPCRQIDAHYITRTPCAMECRVERIIDFPSRAIILGEVVEMTVRDDCMDAQGRYVNPDVYQPIARLHADNYIVADRQFELLKPAEAATWEAAQLTPKTAKAR